jgi:hypothetical protein
MKNKDYEDHHLCDDGKMPPATIAGSIVKVEGIWYQIKGNNPQNIRNCPYCGVKLP